MRRKQAILTHSVFCLETVEGYGNLQHKSSSPSGASLVCSLSQWPCGFHTLKICMDHSWVKPQMGTVRNTKRTFERSFSREELLLSCWGASLYTRAKRKLNYHFVAISSNMSITIWKENLETHFQDLAENGKLKTPLQTWQIKMPWKRFHTTKQICWVFFNCRWFLLSFPK